MAVIIDNRLQQDKEYTAYSRYVETAKQTCAVCGAEEKRNRAKRPTANDMKKKKAWFCPAISMRSYHTHTAFLVSCKHMTGWAGTTYQGQPSVVCVVGCGVYHRLRGATLLV